MSAPISRELVTVDKVDPSGSVFRSYIIDGNPDIGYTLVEITKTRVVGHFERKWQAKAVAHGDEVSE